MPRMRVDADTTEQEPIEAIDNLRAACRVLDAMKPCRNYASTQRQARDLARNNIHDEIERLTNIIRFRRARVVVSA